jgi:hypothetical protein
VVVGIKESSNLRVNSSLFDISIFAISAAKVNIIIERTMPFRQKLYFYPKRGCAYFAVNPAVNTIFRKKFAKNIALLRFFM